MCGRFALGQNRARLVPLIARYNVEPEEWVDEDDFHPRHNIAPRSNAPVIRRVRGSQGDGNNDNADENSAPTASDASTSTPATDKLVLQTMQWGVIPHWQRFRDDRTQLNTINARGENLLENSTGMWNALKRRKRCVVPVHGYFEWLKPQPPAPPNGEKKAHFVRHKDEERIMLLAGLWDSVTLQDTPNAKPLQTFSIVTVETNEKMRWLHDRMPVILHDEKDVQTWLSLDNNWEKQVSDLVRVYSGPDLECYPVPKEVGKVGTDSPSFVQPVSQRKDGIQAMFAKQKASKAGPSSSSSPDKSLSTRSSQSSTSTSSRRPSTTTNTQDTLQAGDVIEPRNTDEPEVIEIVDSSQPEDEPTSTDDVIDLTADSVPSSPVKRKRTRSPSPFMQTPRKKKPQIGAASPVKKKQQAAAAKGTAKITNFFGGGKAD